MFVREERQDISLGVDAWVNRRGERNVMQIYNTPDG